MADTDASFDPSALVELMRRSFTQSGDVVTAAASADRLDGPTPCPRFDVRTLVGHMLFAARRLGAAGRREPISEDGPAVTGLADAEWAPSFDKAAGDALSAWTETGATEGDIVLPFGTFPAAVVAQIYVLEQATHAWDLATAIGERHLLDDALAGEVLPIAHAVIQPGFRGEEPMPFAAEADAGPTAPSYERLAAFMGRRPEWRAAAAGDPERADLLRMLGAQRAFLRYTLRGLTDEQAGQRTTVSELCLGGIVKHVAHVERGWADFIEVGPSALGGMDERTMEAHATSFTMLPTDTVAGLMERYQQVADHTDALIVRLGSLDADQPLPEAPWFEKGGTWTARRALLHVLAETAQHAGHADIVREALDGSKTMG